MLKRQTQVDIHRVRNEHSNDIEIIITVSSITALISFRPSNQNYYACVLRTSSTVVSTCQGSPLI